MASSTQSSQHRCVFVGNIPYDATEEQLKQICEEVGPVVHFRLVIDRETGKPKGYGFCEYKDEETALSARRNLQGYEINGRQLRVDFAENDKNTDRNRDQGRGPTGIVSNTDSQRQFVGQSATGDASFYQPMGVSTAIAAATSMAKALGAAQTTNTPNQMGIQSQPLGSDPLTLHLAKMSRIQLNEIMLELKAMATQNKEQARQVLLLHPNLTKAIFQAQFMLGMVTPQMLQMPNILQPAGLPLHPLLPDTRSQQQPQVVPGLPPLPPNTQFTLAKAHDTGGPSLTIPSSSSVQSQNGTLLQFSAYNQAQPLHAQSQILQHGHLPVQSGISTLPSLHHQLPSTLVSRPNPLEGPSSSLNQQIPVPLPQNMGPTISGLKPQITTIVAHPSLADQSLQASGAAKGKQPSDNSHLVARPSKLLRLNDGRAAAADVNMNMIAGASGKPANNGIVGNLIPKTEAAYDSQKTGGQLQLPPDVESALLQQVMSLTPEQISSLPPDQQQQVIQLQQVLRQST